MSRPDEIAVGDEQLRSLTDDLAALHRDTFPRRGFLLGGLAAAVGAGALTACGSGSPRAAATSRPTRPSPYTGELRVVALAVALENLAVAAYDIALRKASAGDYGRVPPAVERFVAVARAQHVDHARGWNVVLDGEGAPRVTGTPLTVAPAELAKVRATRSVAEVATLALALEDLAAATYVSVASTGVDYGGTSTAATIAPVEAMHAAILRFILGQDPVPAAFLSSRSALTPARLTA